MVKYLKSIFGFWDEKRNEKQNERGQGRGLQAPDTPRAANDNGQQSKGETEPQPEYIDFLDHYANLIWDMQMKAADCGISIAIVLHENDRFSESERTVLNYSNCGRTLVYGMLKRGQELIENESS